MAWCEKLHTAQKLPRVPFAVSGDFFENHSLSTRVRLSLANSMFDSRLLFGVESWPCCTGSAIQKLHVRRMKWMRSIDSSRSRDKVSDCSDDVEQSTEHKEPERDVLCRLEQNHTTVDVPIAIAS